MKKYILPLFVVLLLAACSGTKKTTSKVVELKTYNDSLSYSLGVDVGSNVKKQGVDNLDYDLLIGGFKSVYAGDSLAITHNDASAFLRDHFMGEQKRISEKNTAEGKKYLEANKTKEGVNVLPSGLQYKVIKEGSGPSPQLTEMVEVHYRGILIDGTEFDSSYSRGEPLKFPVNGVIAGWTEALQLMNAGAKWQLVIPSALAYGERGGGPVIGPNAVLIFEVELISIVQN